MDCDDPTAIESPELLEIRMEYKKTVSVCQFLLSIPKPSRIFLRRLARKTPLTSTSIGLNCSLSIAEPNIKSIP
jgi:hypothetical protein